jgi:hypothetical protein
MRIASLSLRSLFCAIGFLLATRAALAASPIELWPSAHGGAFYDGGTLGSVASDAFGGGLGFEADNLFIERIFAGISVDYSAYMSSIKVADSLQQWSAVALGGYRFPITGQISLTPKLGAGFGGMIVKSDGTSTTEGQAFLVAQVTGSWSFLPEWRTDATLAYRGMPESSGWYSAIGLELGLAWRLPVPRAAEAAAAQTEVQAEEK